MADARILDFVIPTVSGLTLFQIQFGDGIEWTLLKVDGVDELDDSLIENRVYTLDGVNTTDDGDNNGNAASQPPRYYRTRVKGADNWTAWTEPIVYPSPEDFVLGMKNQLSDPSLTGGQALMTNTQYRLHLDHAVAAFEVRHPNSVTQLFDMADSIYSYALPFDWDYGFSSIVQVELPYGEIPKQFIPDDYLIVDEEISQWRFRRSSVKTGESALIYFTKRHSRTGSTIPRSYYNSVLLWAVGSCAQQLKGKSNQFGNVSTGADFMLIDNRIKEWGNISTENKKQAEKMWGTGKGSVRAHLPNFEDHGAIPGSVWS